MSNNEPTPHHDPDSGVIGTTQSLIVAFVLAMTFRGFVAEGFVIPTGSMAPTLLGEHHLIHSDVTGWTFPVGVSGEAGAPAVDPMLGPDVPLSGGLTSRSNTSRAGDRILVLKGLYSFAEPKRWDVIVFKNPTDPQGEAGNYIKRLAGLPNETIWIADGDVFARQLNEDLFRVQRKPEHIQRALWRPIHHSDYIPVQDRFLARTYHGPPWVGSEWDTSGRSYRTDLETPTTLYWDEQRRSLDDWTAYNMLGQCGPRSPLLCPVPVSDLRVAAGVVRERDSFEMTLELEARGHVFQFEVSETSGAATAAVRYRNAEDEAWIAEDVVDGFDLPAPGSVFNVECWHVDQAMSLYVDGKRLAHLEYEWQPDERIEHATGSPRDRSLAAGDGGAQTARLRWHFAHSPVTLHRVRVDRDLHYRSAYHTPNQQRQEPKFTGPAYGTHPDNLAELGPDHFFMLGDNSQQSLDSRLWGSPHELIKHHLGDGSPFVVHRKLLLGKAWVVYFPAPLRSSGRWAPDFGRLRYIR